MSTLREVVPKMSALLTLYVTFGMAAHDNTDPDDVRNDGAGTNEMGCE
jgi:hypothetical protein